MPFEKLDNLPVKDTRLGFVMLSASAAIWFGALSQVQSDAVTKFHLASV